MAIAEGNGGGRSFGWLKTAFNGIVAAFAGVGTAAATLFLIAPDLKQRESLGAELDRVAITQGVGFMAYRDAMTPPGTEQGDGPDPAKFATEAPGIVVLAHANLSGFKDRSYNLSLDLIDPNTQRSITPKAPAGKYVGQCLGSAPEANSDSIVFRCWWMAPQSKEVKYRVRATLVDAGSIDKRQQNEKRGAAVVGKALDFIESDVVTALGPEH